MRELSDVYRAFEYIEKTYDLSKIKKIFLNADGGSWIKTGNSKISGITYVLNEFHMSKYLVKMTSYMTIRYLMAEQSAIFGGFPHLISECKFTLSY